MRALVVMLVIWLVPAVLVLVAALWIITRARLSPPNAETRSVERDVNKTRDGSVDRDVA